MTKFILKTFLTFFLLGMLFSHSKAEDLLPEVMVGNPRVFYGTPTTNIYGGFSGSEVVYNHTNDTGSTNTAPGQMMGENLGGSVALSGNASYIDGGTGSAISGKGPFAVSLWFKRSGSTGSTEMLSTQFGLPHYDDYKLQIERSSHPSIPNKVTFRIWGVTNCASTDALLQKILSVNGPTVLPTDTNWHHVIAQRVITSTGQKLELWVDGVLYTTPEDSLANIVCMKNNNTPSIAVRTGVGATIVGDPQNLPEYFKGSINDSRIFERSLSGIEAENLFKGTTISNSSLRAHWRLDESSGFFADSSGNGNTAVAVGSVTRNSSDGPAPFDTSQYDNFGYDLFGFDKTALANCVTGILLGQDSCFVSNSSMANVAVMNSRTYINDQPATEVATLLYPPKPLIVGDAYLGALDPNNFAYWGKNLVQNDASHSASTNSYWGIGSYDNLLASDKKKITAAQSEANDADSTLTTTSSTWYLQGSTIIGPTNTDISKYTNGKIWKTTGKTITGNITYSGKGTVIIDGNLIINSGVNFIPADAGSRLGIIVTGDVTLQGNNKIQAVILGYNNFIIGSNSTLMGSFVASRFQSLEDPVSITNTRLIYDTGLNKAWPPIFGELNMPHASE